MLEWAIAGGALLMAGGLVFEAAQWQLTRQVADIALMEAARAGSVHHADPTAIEAAFLRVFRARYASGRPGSATARDNGLMLRTFSRTQTRSGMRAWWIDQLSPTDDAFSRLSDPSLRVPGVAGRRIIAYDVFEQRPANQWLLADPIKLPPRPRGDTTRLRLHLRLTYLHPVTLPGLARVLALWHDTHGDAVTRRAWRAGLIPMRLETQIEMQSHAVQWRNLGRGAELRMLPSGSYGKTSPRPALAPSGSGGRGTPSPQDRPMGDATKSPPADRPPTHRPTRQDDLCGTVLCCVGEYGH